MGPIRLCAWWVFVVGAALAVAPVFGQAEAGGTGEGSEPGWAGEVERASLIDRGDLVGEWRGGYSYNGSVMRTRVRFFEDATGSLSAEQGFDEWFFYPYGSPVPVEIDGDVVRFGVRYGEAELVLDGRYGDLIGPVETASGAEVRLHLKKWVDGYDAWPGVREVALSFESDVELSGTLVLPESGAGPFPCVVRVGGRGAWSRARGLQFARFFARYGVATLAYDRRGVGASGGDYGSSTHEQTVRDARAALRAAAGHPMVEGERVGLFGTSAGAWTVQDVAGGPFEGDDVRPAFVMTFVGPAVSVEAQQRGTGRRIAEREGWGLERRRLIDRALELSCAADRAGDRRVFIELDALLAKGRAGGWIGEVFVDPAEPSSVPALDGLWVRRYAYDPADDLRRIGVPYLGVFGEDDFIVGWRESVSALERAFAGDRAELLTTVVVAGQGHSVEHGDTRRSLATDDGRGVIDYFKFDRVDARFMQAVAEFLVSRGFAAR